MCKTGKGRPSRNVQLFLNNFSLLQARPKTNGSKKKGKKDKVKPMVCIEVCPNPVDSNAQAKNKLGKDRASSRDTVTRIRTVTTDTETTKFVTTTTSLNRSVLSFCLLYINI